MAKEEIEGVTKNAFNKKNLTLDILKEWVDYNPDTGELFNKVTGREIKPTSAKCNAYKNSTLCFNRSYFGSKFLLNFYMTGEKIESATDLFFVNGDHFDLRWDNIQRKDFDNDPESLEKWINRKVRKNSGEILYGFGINDLDHNVIVRRYGETVWECPFHRIWNNILIRCYDEETLKKHPSYENCSMSEEWKYASKFKEWMEKQDWEGKTIDKDILRGHRSQYSPQNCIFVDSYINGFFSVQDRIRNNHPYPIGVNKKTSRFNIEKPYRARINLPERIDLGSFYTAEEAHRAWQKAKYERCEVLIKEYINDKNVVKGLERLRDQIKYEYDNYLLTETYK